MASVLFENKSYDIAEGESVLDALLRHELSPSYSCMSGVCQTCKLQAIEDSPLPEASQSELTPQEKSQNWFLACQCYPQNDIVIKGAAQTYKTKIIESTILNSYVCRLRLEKVDISFQAGQFINVEGPNGLSRSYSLASLPEEDFLELHIAKVENGRVSSWLHELNEGDELTISEASGQCYYLDTFSERPLVMAATGTGLAPLYGIVRDALNKGHKGSIDLYHAAGTIDKLYYISELKSLAEQHEQLTYHPCLKAADAQLSEAEIGDVREIVKARPLTGKEAGFLCGNPIMVNNIKKALYLSGTAMSDILSDPFVKAAD